MFDNLIDKARDLAENEQVKDAVEKATEFIKSEKGQEVVETVKEKITDIFSKK